MKNYKVVLTAILILFLSVSTFLNAEEEEIYLKSISDQIEVITKDLKTLEKAVYQKSDVTNSSINNLKKSDGLNEDILTKHLLKLNEIEDQFRELTNKFEEVNFKLDKLSTRVTKIQSDNQLRFADIESQIFRLKKITKLLCLELVNLKILELTLDTKLPICHHSKRLIQSKALKRL